MTKNKLALETSPYLQQHKNNPVQWYPWGHQALDNAKSENKPILLSIGYSACHWCHVMAHESFENDEISNIMNSHFINIKVDREERPDLDDLYQTALMTMGQRGGWPLTMILTPDLEPFWGGTYVPPTPRFGMPGFGELLNTLNTAWKEQSPHIQNNIEHLKQSFAAIQADTQKPKIAELTKATLKTVAERLCSYRDPIHGGFQGAPKFPQAPVLQYLWQAWQNTHHKPYYDHVTLTLKRMGDGGLYDHIGGGFARYATDEIWLVPHFEKMLYDNALLIQIMSDVYLQTHDENLKTKVQETINWAFNEMKITATDETYAFATALDADSKSEPGGENKEGQYYVWSEPEIDAVLGRLSTDFKARYCVTSEGNWAEGSADLGRPVNILHVNGFEKLTNTPDEFKIERQKLYEHRVNRPAPSLDHKVLCDVNAMMVVGLLKAGLTFENETWLLAAEKIYAFLSHHLVRDERLYHCWTDGNLRHFAVLDDVAHMANAALALYKATQKNHYLTDAEKWAQHTKTYFAPDKSGLYYLSAKDVTDVLYPSQKSQDTATPNGSGILAHVLAQLSLISGKIEYREELYSLLHSLPLDQNEQLINSPTLLSAYDWQSLGSQIIIIKGEQDATEWIKIVHQNSNGLYVLSVIEPNTQYSSPHPAANKTTVNNQTTAYVCRGHTCSKPITQQQDLINTLQAP